MKRYIITIIYFFHLSYSFAQGPTLPPLSPIIVGDANKLITTYNSTHPDGSFLIQLFTTDKTGLGDYICDPKNSKTDIFLHVYIASKDGSNKNDGSDQFLIIAATIPDPATKKTLIHDPKALGVWMTNYRSPRNCVATDNFDNNNGLTFGCQVDNKTTYGLVDLANIGTLTPYLKNYQSQNVVAGQIISNVTESFLISGNDIRTYLEQGYDASPGGTGGANNPEQYFQFYFGTNSIAIPNTPPDNLTMILIGVGQKMNNWGNNKGFRIFATDKYLFNEGLPCPKCNVTKDVNLDNHPQFNGALFTGDTTQINTYIPFNDIIKESSSPDIIVK